MSRLVLTAPIAGWLMPLDEVPDPAFAAGMLGDGIAIDPTGSTLVAPCDGVVTLLAETRHAVTLQSECGAQILLHVGIDTVDLAGDGFVARTRPGARVRRGEPLLELDLDRLARGAASLVTPIVATDGAACRVTRLNGGCLVATGDPVLEIVAAETGAGQVAARAAAPDATGRVMLRLEHGLHARPAARIARASRRFAAHVVVSARGREAEAGSTVGLMALGVACGDTLELTAFGEDAVEAVRALLAEIEDVDTASPGRRAPAGAVRPENVGVRSTGDAMPTFGLPAGRAPAASEPPGKLSGVVASPGIALGVAKHFELEDIPVPESGAGVPHERAALDAARAAVRASLADLAGPAAAGGDMLAAQCEFLDDPGLLEAAHAAIADGKSAGFAWREASRRAREQLAATGDARLAERAADLRDLELQVLASLTGREPEAPALPDAAIVLARELLPSQLGRLDLTRVAGFCSAAGGPTSHVALLAASLGIPAVVGAGPGVLAVRDGVHVLLDAESGSLQVEPTDEIVATARSRIAERRSRRERFLRESARDAVTADGQRIEVLANLASLAEAASAVRLGAEGCGLLRTEFLFQHRAAAPGIGEQVAEYRAIAEALSPRPLVIRLLDAGGDKPIPYLRLPREANPLLGMRGLRVLLDYPELLRDQLAAILRANDRSSCRILLPMVTEPGEVRHVRGLLAEIAGAGRRPRIALGAMIETPASVALAAAIAREADFLSIGSNDLAQYTLAIDRAHPQLARAFDDLHPAVLRQIESVVAAATRNVSVCGALASNVQAVPVLIGLGVRMLSVVPSAIPELKALLRTLHVSECRELAAAALAEHDAAGVRKLLDGTDLARCIA